MWRDKKATKRMLLALLKRYGFAPKCLVTDKLRSSGVVMADVVPSLDHLSYKRLNNRAKKSRLPFQKGANNAIPTGYFKTPLNQALVDSCALFDWLGKSTPAGRGREVAELVGAAVFLSYTASSFVNGQILFVDRGVTASL